jgi:hypothetical protein
MLEVAAGILVEFRSLLKWSKILPAIASFVPAAMPSSLHASSSSGCMPGHQIRTVIFKLRKCMLRKCMLPSACSASADRTCQNKSVNNTSAPSDADRNVAHLVHRHTCSAKKFDFCNTCQSLWGIFECCNGEHACMERAFAACTMPVYLYLVYLLPFPFAAVSHDVQPWQPCQILAAK